MRAFQHSNRGLERRLRSWGLWVWCVGATPLSFMACSDDGNLLGTDGKAGSAGTSSVAAAGMSSSTAGTHANTSGASGSAGMATTTGGSETAAAGSTSAGSGGEHASAGAAGEHSGGAAGEAGAGHGGTGTLDTGSCSVNSDCAPCAYGAPPASANDCYCTSCPGAAASTAQCDLNRHDYLDVCPNGQPTMCAGVACVPPPVAQCVQGKCAVVTSPICNGQSCGTGLACVAYRTVGGAIFPPDQSGKCETGRHVENGSCQPDFAYTCARLSNCTSLGSSCHCATGSLCERDPVCRLPVTADVLSTPAVLICEQQAP